MNNRTNPYLFLSSASILRLNRGALVSLNPQPLPPGPPEIVLNRSFFMFSR